MYVPLLVDDFLLRPAKLFPQKIAIIDNDRQYTYADYQRRVNQLSHALIAMGVKQGERVCILSPNSHFFLESFYATSQIGAILVPLNYRMVPDDHQYIINHAGVTTLLVDYEYTEMIDGIRSQLAKVRNWIVAAHDDVERPGWSDWEALIAPQSGGLPAAIERDENDIVSINYTSGTTARPKGVMLTHRNLYLNAYSLISHLQVCHDDVELWTLAMFHTNGWGAVYALTGQGGTHVVMRAVEGRQIYDLIEQTGVTLACMAPAVLRIVLDYPDKDQHNITTTPRFIVAGAAPPATFIERLEKELGWRFIQIYGLTETAPFLTSSQPDFATLEDDYARRARAGTPGIGVEIKLIDDAGHEVPKDGTSIGEVCARSSVVFEGYWDQQEETEKAIYDGYFHTGDLAVWDEQFNIHIVDRKKDVIISGGENISSPEIEDTLYKHPAVLDCAVIGVPHEKWGETPKALIVLREGSTASAEQVISFCREKLAHFKCPTSVEFIDTLPRTVTGKLQKARLREQYWSDDRRNVAG